MRIIHPNVQYEDYIKHQKKKTLDPARRKKWLGLEWQQKIDGFTKIFQKYLRVGIISENARCLCIGARTGQEVVALQGLGLEAIGIDIVPNPPYVQEGDMHDLQFEDNSFDFIFSNVFDHAKYPHKKCSEIERVLRADGCTAFQLQVGVHQDEYTEVEIENVYHDVISFFNKSVCVINNRIPRNFAGMNYEIVFRKNEKLISLNDKIGELHSLKVPESYKIIWKDISFLVQVNKARTHGLSEQKMQKCLLGLIKRPYYLSEICKWHGAKNILEVGTAEGLQFYSFAEAAKDSGGHVWSCDIKDKRNRKYADIYSSNTTFCLGTSKELGEFVKEKIDLFYIDASHQKGAVLKDIENLKHLQSENPIWIFDDFDARFGCFDDIRSICDTSEVYKVYRVGDAASGNPNHQVIVFGSIP